MEHSIEVINLFHSLSQHPRNGMYPTELKFAVAHLIEEEITQKCKNNSDATYQCEIYSFKINLNPNSLVNKGVPSMLLTRVYHLMSIIMLGFILPSTIYDRLITCKGVHNIATIVRTPTYAFSIANIPHIDYAERRSKIKINYKTTKLYECSKCHARETIIIEKQVRCLDEPTTAFITCMKCGHSWKN